jgi:hypothetical protein
MYANEIYLGHGNYGVEAACRYYFGKSVKDVTLAEAALLAGIVQRPEDQSPFRNPTLAKQRRATALRRMQAAGYVSDAERRAAEAEPLPSAPSLAESIVGPYFCEEIRQYLEKTYGEKDLYARGLRVESTLDPSCSASPRRRSGGGCGESAASTGSTSPATCSSRATGRSRRTWTRPGRTPDRGGRRLPRRRHEDGRGGSGRPHRQDDDAPAQRRRAWTGRRRREDPEARRPRPRVGRRRTRRRRTAS